ncbi:hypothetical protein E2C01_019478 [Portunus trituberculatus]|uniref:Uncharacterized protein n=1 Tax=Portunus trituberculatus TaxID=210409 RepID=A0A5B7DZI2_PORTR|nr:hypothetical protein [Portunus trituberculatus]
MGLIQRKILLKNPNGLLAPGHSHLYHSGYTVKKILEEYKSGFMTDNAKFKLLQKSEVSSNWISQAAAQQWAGSG